VVLENVGEISWTDRVKNEVLHRVKEERNIVHTGGRRKANWIGHILCRNCLLRHFIEGKVQGRGRRGRRRNQLLGTLNWKRQHWIALIGELPLEEAMDLP
jgi:hypothetical protein